MSFTNPKIMDEIVFINGEFKPAGEASLLVTDLAILRGYGIFDFFRAIDGKPIFIEDHLDRFEKSMAGLHLETEYSRDDLRSFILRLIDLNPHPLLGVKMVCTGGYSRDGYTPHGSNLFMLARPFAFHPFDKGLSLMTAEHRRELHEVKTINYLTPVSLLPKMKEAGADDVLYHKDGRVSESSRSNVFMIKNGTLITPDSDMLLGVTRKRILSFAREILPVEVRPVLLQELLSADEVFLTASTKRISPVTRIDRTSFAIGPYTRKLYDRLVTEEQW